MEEILPDAVNKVLHQSINHVYSLAPIFEATVVLGMYLRLFVLS